MDLEKKHLVLEVPGLDDLPLSKQNLFCGVAKLVYLRMYRDHHEASLEELRKELLNELGDCGNDMGTTTMGKLIFSI